MNNQNVVELGNSVISMDNRDDLSFIHLPLQVGAVGDEVAVIIDGASLSVITRQIIKGSIDYKKLMQVFTANFPCLRSVNFLITEFLSKEDPNNSGREFKQGYSQIRSLLDWMRKNRYTVISRTAMMDGPEGSFPNNINTEDQMDVDITTALYKAARYANHIVFLGSSKKYCAPLRDLREQGKTITVMGARRPEGVVSVKNVKYTSDELREIDNFVDLQDPFFQCILKPPNPKRFSETRAVTTTSDESTD